MAVIKSWMVVAAGMAGAMGAGVAAAASPTVSLYGEFDMAVGRTYSDAAKTGMVSGYTGDTKIGFKGSEDLGQGVKLNFQLEASQLDGSTGAWTGGFKRQSWLGFSGKFGDFKMGRTTTPQNRAMGQFDLNGSADSSALEVLGLAANGSFVGSRESNQLQYITPRWNGVQAWVAYGFSETVRGAPNAKRNFMQVAGTYKTGGLTLGAAYQPERFATQAVSNNNYRDGYSVGAKYDFGVVKTSVLYTRNPHVTDGEGWGVGVMAPLGAWELGVQFARVSKAKKANGHTSDKQGAHAVELFTNYSLSKRTTLYGAYGTVDSRTTEHAFGLQHGNTAALGITHAF